MTIEFLGELLIHIEAIHISTCGTKDGCIESIDWSLAIKLSKTTCFECTIQIPKQHYWPVSTTGVLLVSIITRVDDQRVIHHRATALGDAIKSFHDFY